MLNIIQLRVASMLFSIMAGIINIFGIKQLGIVVTNVTGHFSNLVPDNKTGNLQLGLDIVSSIIVYFLGSFFASSCFTYGKNKNNLILKSMAPISILLILILVFFINNLPIYFLFFLSSTQNAFASNHSNSEIKPSQITGVVMNTGYDLSKFIFDKETLEDKNAVFQSFTYKLFNILGFIIGVNIAFYVPEKTVLIIPIIFYLIITLLVLSRKF